MELATAVVLLAFWAVPVAAQQRCTPGLGRLPQLHLVSEGGLCEGGPANGEIYCAILPQDIYDCCGGNRSVLECMSSQCCGPEYEYVPSIDLPVVEPAAPLEVPPEFGECRVADGQPCDLGYLRENQGDKQGWVVFLPDLTCMDGSEYAFQVFPGTSDNRLLLWFQGGGGCWDYESCARADTIQATRSVRLNTGGIFDMTNTDNPVVTGDWTVVHINYCTADLFVGNVTREFTASDSDISATVNFSGFKNTQAVLDWLNAQQTSDVDIETSRRVAGGCSAGSAGSQLWRRYLVDSYGFEEAVFDSLLGILPPKAEASTVQAIGACSVGKAALQWDSAFVDDCTAGNFSLPEFTNETIAMSPDYPVTYMGYINDIVQRAFYIASASPGNYSDKKAFVEAAAFMDASFPSTSAQIIEGFGAASEEFFGMMMAGQEHCVLPLDSMYDPERTVPATGKSVLATVDDILNYDIDAAAAECCEEGGPVAQETPDDSAVPRSHKLSALTTCWLLLASLALSAAVL